MRINSNSSGIYSCVTSYASIDAFKKLALIS
ncbi:hypothetical protein V6N12_066632 [Hibiscus sabdariffa]|uniref:Uncharacterized protein n=1 Tax=Hibiscus sabdariffa TaxID=183260 RepID=A0ABR2CQQ3_9ROSI